jgi:hypothetical protein
MKSKTTTSLCIQAEPNRLGIDYGRIILTPNVKQRLVHLCKILDPYQLHSVTCTKTPVQWYKAGQPLNGNYLSKCSLVGSERDQDLVLYVDGTILGEIDEHGVHSQACDIQGHWIFCSLAELDEERLLQQADEYGDIHATSDYGTPLIDVASRGAELRRALHPAHNNSKTFQAAGLENTAWPDPFDRWQNSIRCESRAHLRLPRTFRSEMRSPVADAVLAMLFQAVLKQDWDPNLRCAFYTLAAAIIICPQEVTLTGSNGDIPLFLRNLEQEIYPNEFLLRIEDVTPHNSRVCGNCDYAFESRKVVRLRYQNITGDITIDTSGTVIAASWSATHQMSNLALLYEDHANNAFAWQVMHQYAHKYTDDLSRLKLLAFGLDVLKRLLDDDQPWLEIVRVAMESPDSGYGKSE